MVGVIGTGMVIVIDTIEMIEEKVIIEVMAIQNLTDLDLHMAVHLGSIKAILYTH